MNDLNFELIEDKVIAALEATGVYKTVATYSGNLADDIKKKAYKSPAAFVMYDGGPEHGLVDGHNIHEPVKFTIITLARSFRGKEAARKGAGTNEPGAYDALEAEQTALVNQKFGLDIIRLRRGRRQLLYSDASTVAYATEYTTSFDRTYDQGE